MPESRLRQISLGVISKGNFRTHKHAILKQLSDEVGEACNINIPDGSRMRSLDCVKTYSPLRLRFVIDIKVLLHFTARGKTFSLSASR